MLRLPGPLWPWLGLLACAVYAYYHHLMPLAVGAFAVGFASARWWP